MSLTLEQVRRVAHLARIEVSDAEAESTLGHLNGIFALIEAMQAVDTQGVEPMAHAQDLAQRLRTDSATEPVAACLPWPGAQTFRTSRRKPKPGFTSYPG